MLTGSSPIFVAADIVATVKFYEEVLGFPSTWTWGDPPTFGGANWGKVMIMFNLDPKLIGNVEGHGHWIDVENVDQIYAQHVASGAMIVSQIEDKPWGKREYTVRDLNGYHIRFVGDPTYVSLGSGTLPEGIQIVCRMPTLEEYERVAGEIFYRKGIPGGILERTWRSILATDQTDEFIGMTRIAYDAPGWFSICDGAVLPDWQGNRIGTAMMEAALNLIREESPARLSTYSRLKMVFITSLGLRETMSR